MALSPRNPLTDNERAEIERMALAALDQNANRASTPISYELALELAEFSFIVHKALAIAEWFSGVCDSAEAQKSVENFKRMVVTK